MSDTDTKSRLTVTTRTVGSEYYDQVLAMSAHIVNDGWEQLWKTSKTPDLTHIKIQDDDLGSIDASLLPCRITFDGKNREGIRVYYYIRFDKGTLASKKSQGLKQTVDGWCLCVAVRVSEQKKSEMTADQVKYINDNYSVPGDYSIARLFADLSDARFDNMEPERSTFGTGEDGKPITWDQWSDAHEDLVLPFLSFMTAWKLTMKKKGYSTLGVKVVIPDMKDQNPLDPTYPPTAMLHQGFKYQNAKTDPKVAADYDCLLYCEQLMGRAVPESSFIADGGNWCYPEDGSNPAVHGTFAISGQIFFQRKNGLLEHLRPLAALTEITLTGITIDDTGDRYHYFDIGHNKGHSDPNDDYFLAKIDSENRRYLWKKCQYQEKGSTSKYNVYNYYWQKSEQQVTVSWKPGDSTLTLAGEVTYTYEATDWNSPEKTYRRAILWESYTASWSLSIVMTTDAHGRLLLTLGTRPEDTTVNVTKATPIDSGGWVRRENTIEGYMKDMKDSLQNALKPVAENLVKIFQTTGQWIYPGNGVLYYRQPMFNNTGDVLAEVQYKSLDSKAEVPPPHPGPSLIKYARSVPNAKAYSCTRNYD